MNRRRFLSLLGQATVGATVAYSFPSIIVPKNIQPFTHLPRGLAYLVNDRSRILQGLYTTNFPILNSPSSELSGVWLTPQLFEYTRERLNAMIRMTSENPMLSVR